MACWKTGKRAVKWYEKAAENYNADAQYSLGFCYERGIGVTQDFAKAAEWYREAAEQGDMTSQCNLGYLYESGRGVEKDLAKAAEWYRESAEQGIVHGRNAILATAMSVVGV